MRFDQRCVLPSAIFCLVPFWLWSVAHAQYGPPPPVDFQLPPPSNLDEGSPASDPPPVVTDTPPTDVPPEDVPAMLAESGTLSEPLAASPTWYNPLSWIGPNWDGSFEVGINGAKGNSDALSFRTGFEFSRETTRSTWDLDLTYSKNEADGVITQHNALFYSNWDYKLANPRWSWFNKLGLEYDEFRDFNIRVFPNTGLGYLLIDTDGTQVRPRLGSGTSREFGGSANDWIPESVLGFDFSQQVTDRQKFSAVVDFYPAWDDFSDYRLIADLSWEWVIDRAANLSLKMGILDRYDSTPNGADPNDLNYSLLLLWTL